MSHSQLQGQPACHAKRSCRLPCRAADCPRCQDMGSSSAATPCLSGTSNCVWCCSSGGLAPHVLENKALFDRFGVPSDLLLQDLTFEDEQAKKVSPKNKKCPYMAHQHFLVPGGSPTHFQSVYLPVCCTCFFGRGASYDCLPQSQVPSSVSELHAARLNVTVCCNGVPHAATAWLANANCISHYP